MSVAKVIILVGVALIVLGGIWVLAERVGLGQLPGDLVIRGERFTLFLPLMTCLMLSVLLSLFLWMFSRWSQ